MARSALVAIALLLSSAVSALASPSKPIPLSARLLGAWVVDQSVGLPQDRHLRVCRKPGGWSVRTEMRASSSIKPTTDGLVAEFPDGSQFRGPPPSAGPVRGYWVQPSNAVLVSYATPVSLQPTGRGCWRGLLTPLEPKVRFSIVFRRNDAGALTADYVDPRWGSRRSLTVAAVWRHATLSDARARLTVGWDVTAVGLTTHWDKRRERIIVTSDALPWPIIMTRSSGGGPGLTAQSGQAVDFASAPPRLQDGWNTGSLASEGIDPGRVRALIESIRKGGDLASSSRRMQALLIARHGHLVFEDYFYDFDRAQLHDMRSAGKTLAPMLIGAAVAQGAPSPLDEPVSKVFARYRPFLNDDARKEHMTVRDLISMRSGLDCDDDSRSAPASEDAIQQQTITPDWYRYTLDAPMAAEPGGDRAVYCSADLNLGGGVARIIAHQWLPQLFDESIAQPLQIGRWAMNLMPTGEGYMGGGLYLAPRDQLKLGQLYLNGGIWNGKQIVSADWVAQSITPYGRFRPVIARDANHRYGLGWHVHDLVSGGHVYREYSAEGAGGQFVIVIPALDMVVAIAGADYTSINWYNWLFDVTQDYLIPAAVAGAP